MTELIKRFSNLSPEQRTLLLRKLHQRGLPAPALQPDAEPAVITGPVPLLPQQKWLLEDSGLPPHQFYIPSIFAIAGGLDMVRLDQALRHVLEHHDQLRARFWHAADGWHQEIAPLQAASPFLRVDLAALPADEQRGQIERISQHLHGHPTLDAGPLQLVYFHLGAGRPDRLLLLVHHLVTDDLSMAILFEDLVIAYQQLNQGQAVRLPPKTTSLKCWAERLAEYAQSPAIQQDLDYWRSLPWERLAPLQRDFPDSGQASTFSSVRSFYPELSEEETAALLQLARGDRDMQVQEVLLAALAYALAQWAGHDAIHIMLLGHGRYPVFPDIDLSRTIGWLATGTPLVLIVAKDRPFAEVVSSIIAQCRRVPLHGISHGVLERLSPYAAEVASLRAHYEAEIEFNYGGLNFSAPSAGSWLHGPSDEQVRQTEGLLVQPSSRLLGWKGIVLDGRLAMKWSYSEDSLLQASAERIMDLFSAALRSLARDAPQTAAMAPPRAEQSSTDL